MYLKLQFGFLRLNSQSPVVSTPTPPPPAPAQGHEGKRWSGPGDREEQMFKNTSISAPGMSRFGGSCLPLIKGLLSVLMLLSFQQPETRRGQQKDICFPSVERKRTERRRFPFRNNLHQTISDKMLLNQ